MIAIEGVGWLDDRHYGRVRQRFSTSYAGRVALRALGRSEGLFAYPVKNFGRFDATTRRVCYATALALRDAAIDYAQGSLLNIGLLGTSETGCLEANRAFFQDYVDGGRTLSRANLFIYTLPSSPLAEAAVHFGLSGPQLYLRTASESLKPLLQRAAGMIRRGEAEKMLVCRTDATETVCLALGDSSRPLCPLATADALDGDGGDSTRLATFIKAAMDS